MRIRAVPVWLASCSAHAPMFLRWLTSIFLALPVFLAVAHAQAQPTITLAQERSLPRLDHEGNVVAKRPLTQSPEGINRLDCLDDQRIRFALLLSGFEANGVLEAWASPENVDCALAENRTPGSLLCWKLVAPIPLASLAEVEVPVRAIVSGAPPASPVALVADERICGQVDLTSIAVQFLYFAPGDPTNAAASKKVSIIADTVGPAPPGSVSALPGAGQARVSWDPRAPGAISTVTGANVYCEPLADAGACSGTEIAAGTVPTPELDDARLCGSLVGSTGQTAVAAPLPNDVPHAFAVSFVDAFGNVGPLSSPACATPMASDDGESAEGGCATTTAKGGSWTTAACAALLAIGTAARRRRQSKR